MGSSGRQTLENSAETGNDDSRSVFLFCVATQWQTTAKAERGRVKIRRVRVKGQPQYAGILPVSSRLLRQLDRSRWPRPCTSTHAVPRTLPSVGSGFENADSFGDCSHFGNHAIRHLVRVGCSHVRTTRKRRNFAPGGPLQSRNIEAAERVRQSCSHSARLGYFRHGRPRLQ